MATKTRNSGLTAGEEISAEAVEHADEPTLPQLDVDSRRRFRTPGFQRWRLTWSQEDMSVLDRFRDQAEKLLMQHFGDAYRIMSGIYDLVREPVTVDGEPVRDLHGFIVWRRDDYGLFVEDWEKMTRKEKEHYLFLFTTRQVEWEQRVQDLWGESMMAKSQWEERNAIAFDAPMSGTMGDRDAAARKDSAEERYFAVYMTILHRKAEALVKSLDRLAQRLSYSLYGQR